MYDAYYKVINDWYMKVFQNYINSVLVINGA
jgi:hypothetical protein